MLTRSTVFHWQMHRHRFRNDAMNLLFKNKEPTATNLNIIIVCQTNQQCEIVGDTLLSWSESVTQTGSRKGE